MKFVLVNDRTPSRQSSCVLCREPIGTGYLQGTGTGPQVRFSPYTQTSLGGGFATPSSLAVDGTGNVYVADETDAVKVIPSGCISFSAALIESSRGFSGYPSFRPQ